MNYDLECTLEEIQDEYEMQMLAFDNGRVKIEDFNKNYNDKLKSFNDNATEKTTEFNTNATNKTTDFNDNYNNKLTSFNTNYQKKLDDFNDNAESMQKEIDYLKKKNTTLENAGLKVSAEGTEIELENTVDGVVMDLEMEGNTSQVQPTGKNHLYPTSQLVEETINGVKFSPMYDSNGLLLYINANGTASANASYTFISANNRLRIPQGNYFVSGSNNGGNNSYYLRFSARNIIIYNNYNGDTSLNLSSDDDLWLTIEIVSGTTLNNIKFYPMMRLSTITDDTYEPYTGGQASPSPDYPQNINVVTGNNTITVSNKNNTKNQSFPLTLGDLEVCQIGDYKDFFFKNTIDSKYYDSTLELNKWYLRKNIDKCVLSSSDVYRENGSGTNTYRFYTSKSLFVSLASGFCNNNKFITSGIGGDNEAAELYFSNGATCIFYRINKSRIDNLTGSSAIEKFQTWLSNNPTYFYSILSTPEYILLNDTLQTQLDNIMYNLPTYAEKTYITQENDDLPLNLNITAVKDLNTLETRLEILESEV